MHPSIVSETDAPEAAIESAVEGVRTSPGMQGYDTPIPYKICSAM